MTYSPPCPFFSESKTYQIDVVTKSSNREEITFIRLSPKAVLRSVEETFKNNINVSKSCGLAKSEGVKS